MRSFELLFFSFWGQNENLHLLSISVKCYCMSKQSHVKLCCIKWKQDNASRCRSPLWQLCQNRTRGMWTDCQSKLPETAGIPRTGRKSSAAGEAQCQPLQKEANLSDFKRILVGFWLIYRAIRTIISQSTLHLLQQEECKRLKLTEFMTHSLKNCNTWGYKILLSELSISNQTRNIHFRFQPLIDQTHFFLHWNVFWSVLVLDFVRFDSLTEWHDWLKLVQEEISALENGP